MKKTVSYTMVLLIGLIIGASYSWVNSYSPQLEFRKQDVGIEDVLKYAAVNISQDNFSCEGDVQSNVGSVVGSIIEINSLFKRNMLSFGCYEEVCTLVVSTCMPWRDMECGERILKFLINSLGEIQQETFTCIDVP